MAAVEELAAGIGHELNNSLAPISSLAHSGRQLAQREQSDKLAELFATVEERSRHLKLFIDGYARFAKLPKPRPAEVEWESFVADIGNQQVRLAIHFERGEVFPVLVVRILDLDFAQVLPGRIEGVDEGFAIVIHRPVCAG